MRKWKYLAPIVVSWVVGRLLRHSEYDLNFLLVSASLVAGLMWAVEGVRRRALEHDLEKLRRDVLYVYCGLYQEGKDKGQFKGMLLQMTDSKLLNFDREMEIGQPMVWEPYGLEPVEVRVVKPTYHFGEKNERGYYPNEFGHRMFKDGVTMVEDHSPNCTRDVYARGRVPSRTMSKCSDPCYVNWTMEDYATGYNTLWWAEMQFRVKEKEAR
jgi:hypothetical protein